MASVSAHLTISDRFLDDGLVEVAAGDLLQGSEKLWGAAAHAIKAVAERRGWQHNGHGHLFRAIGDLSTESGDNRLKLCFRHANRLHRNFYEDTMGDQKIYESARYVSDLVGMLSAIAED